jgi:hypothetical protein
MTTRIFSNDAVESIRNAWDDDQNHPRKNRVKRSLPCPEMLAFLIEEAFIASLDRVEERPTSFAIAVLPREKELLAAIVQGRRAEVIPFEKPIAFSASMLAKLSPGCDPSVGALAVDLEAGEPQGSVIWGAVFFDSSALQLDSGVGCGVGLDAWRPDTLTVSSSSPGSLNITRADVRIGQFTMGRFIRATPNPLSDMAMGAHIRHRLSTSSDDAYDAWYFREFIRWLKYLLVEIGRRGHGGTVVHCTEEDWREARNACHGGHGVVGDLSMKSLVDLRHKEEQNARRNGVQGLLSAAVGIAKINKHMMDRLGFIAQLAVCDGALVVGEHLAPLAYGVMLPAETALADAVTGEDGFGGGGERYDLQRHGMRHRAAASFAARHEGVFCLVVSQDGPVRGFARDREGSLLVWPDCRETMFARG